MAKSNADLGMLQRDFESARRTLNTKSKNFQRADRELVEAKNAFQRASLALDNGMRSVRDGSRDA